MGTIVSCAIGGILYYGAGLVVSGEMTSGLLTSYLQGISPQGPFRPPQYVHCDSCFCAHMSLSLDSGSVTGGGTVVVVVVVVGDGGGGGGGVVVVVVVVTE